MPITRSTSSSSINLSSPLKAVALASPPATPPRRPRGRPAPDTGEDDVVTPSPSPSKKRKSAPADVQLNRPLIPNPGPALLPPKLSFDFEAARSHIISCDARFERVFEKLKCRPFQEVDELCAFRSLSTSIIGQQVSWLAARSINHKFRRIFFPSLPEKPAAGSDDREVNDFPTPAQVAVKSVEELKSAGLSMRKAEYVQSLAQHFVDGRLSARFLQDASVEEVSQALLDVRGIGQWTVDMFLIFSLRRPDILPVGDLGVQKGLLKWVLSAYKNDLHIPDTEPPVEPSSVIPGEPSTLLAIDLERSLHLCPPGFDPSIAYPLPTDLSIDVLKSRLAGKKIKGAYLSPGEMDLLTSKWQPYRSLGVYYMWAVAEETS